jgi:hypothetical protein
MGIGGRSGRRWLSVAACAALISASGATRDVAGQTVLAVAKNRVILD